MAREWDPTLTPVLLAGADGNIHETRPTTSLARDLEQAELHELRSSLPSVGSTRLRSPDDGVWPVHSDVGHGGGHAGGGSSASQRRPQRLTAADRPISGFGASVTTSASSSSSASASGYPAAAAATVLASTLAPSRRRLSCGSTSLQAASSRAKSFGTMFARSAAATKSVGSAGPPLSDLPRRKGNKTYLPIERLLELGFDEQSARVAMAAAGGDVNLAIRIALEDSQAHDARSVGEWEFEGDKGWLPFDGATESVIKDAAANGRMACEIRIAGHKYLVDLDNLLQVNLATQRTRRIRRRCS